MKTGWTKMNWTKSRSTDWEWCWSWVVYSIIEANPFGFKLKLKWNKPLGQLVDGYEIAHEHLIPARLCDRFGAKSLPSIQHQDWC